VGVVPVGDAGPACGAGGFEEATDDTTPAISVATDLPALATSVTTPTALFITFIVPPITPADIRPARNVSSTPSAKRFNGFGAADTLGAYFDSRKSM
jgi:hypothetical protein